MAYEPLNFIKMLSGTERTPVCYYNARLRDTRSYNADGKLRLKIQQY